MPTDTIYGLHASATNERAVRAITTLKGRDDGKPFVVLGASLAQLENIGIVLSEEARAVLGEIWPAPLTVIATLAHPIAASRRLTSLAVRVPALQWLRDAITRSGPIVSTSANESGSTPATLPSELPANVLTGVEGIVDSGPIEGIASAIVDLTSDEPRLIRTGEPLFTQEMWKTLRKSLCKTRETAKNPGL